MFGFILNKKKILRRPLSAITDLIEAVPVTCGEETSVMDAIELMNENYIGSILIKNKDERIVGIFTERDLLYKIAPLEGMDLNSTFIVEYMTPSPDTLRVTEPISSALEMMRKRNHRHLIIVDEEEKLLKVVSMKDVLYYLCDILTD